MMSFPQAVIDLVWNMRVSRHQQISWQHGIRSLLNDPMVGFKKNEGFRHRLNVLKNVFLSKHSILCYQKILNQSSRKR